MLMANKRCLMIMTGALFYGGGIANANRLALFALLEEGYQVDVITLNETQEDTEVGYPNLTYKVAGSHKVLFTRMCWTTLFRQRYDVVFCDHVNLALILAPLRWLGLRNYMVRLNGVEVFPEFLNWEGKLGLFAAKQRLAISRHTSEKVREQFSTIAIDVCELSLSPERSQMPSQDRQPSQLKFVAIDGSEIQLEEQVILHVGRMSAAEQYKGQDVLIQAMPKILEHFPDAQLVLVGHGDDMGRLRELAESHTKHVQSAIVMTGFVSDEVLEQLYQSCYLFAMPSSGEGFGLVYLEAMRYAKPCIGSRVDAAKFVIVDGETGLLLDNPKDEREVADAILTLLQQTELAQQMGQAGYQRLNQKYLFSHFKNRFINAIQLMDST